MSAADPRDDALIRVRGARVHNLQCVDLDIPRDRLIVVTGPSGSGKSSLAFDTIFAEGQRQYIESLSAYARQFLRQLERPDVDLIDGLPPTIALDQQRGAHNPRSTVGTVTEIYDYLRLLYARVGEASCYRCGRPVRQVAQEEIAAALLRLPERTKVMLLAPLVRGRKGEHQETLAEIRKAGLVRARIDGQVYDLEHAPPLAARKEHHVEAVIDRLVIRPGVETRLAESIDLAVRLADGSATAAILEPGAKDEAGGDDWRDELFSTRYACPDCGVSLQEIEPRTFSFNSPYGACPTCEGLGRLESFDPQLVVPEWNRSLAEGAVAAWQGMSAKAVGKQKSGLSPLLQTLGIDWDTPLSQLTEENRVTLLDGDGKHLGLRTMLEKQLATETSARRREALEAYRDEVVCFACGGARLKPEARSIRVGGLSIHELTGRSIGDARQFFDDLRISETEAPIARPILREVTARLGFLENVGVEYLSLDRSADSLSGGELQRVRLAGAIGAGLVGACYVLDEPTIGLHPRDGARLIETLRRLCEEGNTLLVVEHDEATMRAADLLIDMGPGAGTQGGRIVAVGTPDEVAANPSSLTGEYLSGARRIAMPESRRPVDETQVIELEGVTTNNLKNVSVAIPLGVFACVTGVSGSGKSSLVNETLVPAIRRELTGAGRKPGPFVSLRGADRIERLIEIDQSPLGRTPRSNAATYTGLFDDIRKIFAKTRDARRLGFDAGRFSFNAKGGRCENCRGHGVERIEMNFLPDLYVTCPVCRGARFNEQTLGVRYRDRTIAEILDLPVNAAIELFENVPAVQRMLQCLSDVGLGYLPLGQPSTSLSGGEAQRIKLATELGRVAAGKTFYVLDEPTTGLHVDDIRRLLDVLGRLVDLGNAVLVIEHHLDVIKTADWIIDLGPQGGEQGGRIVATGRPEDIARNERSLTGRYLRSMLG